MRLIGGRDYYDSALAHGQDPELTFVRNHDPDLETLEMARLGVRARAFPGVLMHDRRRGKPLSPRTFFAQSGSWGESDSRLRIAASEIAVVFCGRLRQGLALSVSGGDRAGQQQIVWSRDQLDGWLAGLDLELTAPRRHGLSLDWREDLRGSTLATYFEPENLSREALGALTARRIVIATRVVQERGPTGPSVWRINRDDLKDLAFYKVLDPYAAFQEIAMFVGGVLPRAGAETVEIDDRVRKHKHGFDELSFRTPPKS